ncbi:ATP-binding cassette domain-containing protein [Streptomyces synnematoformans]|uniref:ABC transporter ATP-binding protein n=1 Tax=Streptomyces synnematoformans TaxID=415721 RepID=A0ABN1ZJE3_9ACTN
MIEARGLTKEFGGRRVVDELSFTVEPGHVTGFLGPNGAGKTTTMRMVLGLHRPTGGTVTVRGQRYDGLRAPLHEVGALLDAKGVHRRRTAYHHLLAVAQSNRIGRRRVGQVLELVGMADAARRRAGAFSLGMAQRLGIATALLGDPPVLMLDEPVNGLDPEGMLWIRTLMRELADEGRTVLVSSHLLSEMALTADRLVVIGRGKLIADSSTEEFLSRRGTDAVLVRVAEEAAAEPFARRLAGAGGGVTARQDGALLVTGLESARVGALAAGGGTVLAELTPQAASLEEAFMEMTQEYVEFQASGSGAR